MPSNGWIGVDLDGTLAVYDGWKGEQHIGEPVPLMVDRVKDWLTRGYEVRIFTARVCGGDPRGCREVIQAWCQKHIGTLLPVTNEKDFGMIALYDDRAVAVEENTGILLSRKVLVGPI